MKSLRTRYWPIQRTQSAKRICVGSMISSLLIKNTSAMERKATLRMSILTAVEMPQSETRRLVLASLWCSQSFQETECIAWPLTDDLHRESYIDLNVLRRERVWKDPHPQLVYPYLPAGPISRPASSVESPERHGLTLVRLARSNAVGLCISSVPSRNWSPAGL